ncbi:MAG: YggS family pyridoxal phosphate-dependent enzyme [Bacteroidota bacterium]
MHDPLHSLLLHLADYPAAHLIAVTKKRSLQQIQALYQEGQKAFGENHALEMQEKAKAMPPDCEWHFIGHLQTNKVKSIATHVHTIHSVDSMRLMDEIQKRAAMAQRKIRVLLQVHIAQEEHKFGIPPETLGDFMHQLQRIEHPNLIVSGLMGMATQTEDPSQIRKEFRLLYDLFQQIKTNFRSLDPDFKEISMGMSNDYLLALEEGSTMLRIGSLLFEEGA